LLLGKIDDYDETYINGRRIGRTGKPVNDWGRGNLGDHYLELRAYFIPKDYLNYDNFNQIAVRVFDGFIKGGIYEGPVGIVTRKKYLSWWEEVKQPRFRPKGFFDFLFGN
jgi:sialate O-acetylesterase